MLLHQGVVVGEEEEEGETKQGDWEEEPTTLRHEKKKMEQRQYALEKQLANLHLENQSLKKEMREIKQMEQTQALKAKEVETKRLEIEQSKQVTVEDLTYAVQIQKARIRLFKGREG